MSEGDCSYAFDWYTAAACVLSKTEGDNCQVSDPQAGMYLCSANWKVMRVELLSQLSPFDAQEQSEFSLSVSTY